MKNFLITCAVIVLLLFFPLQFVVSQVNHYRMTALQNIVHNAAQKARTDGYFTTARITEMRNNIIAAFPGINPAEVIITCTTTPKYRKNTFDDREMISYDVRVPIEKIIAMNNFFNISDAANKMQFKIDGQVPSEVLLP